MILLWLLPLVLFLGLILIGRSALFAGVAGTIAAVLVTWHSGPSRSDFPRIFDAFLGGMWIALPAVLVILAGLAFATAIEEAEPERAGPKPSHDDIAQLCLLTGPFMETVAGFGVGYVVTMMGLRRLGICSVNALALAAFSQSLVPWGALGIGTRISAALAGVELQEIGWRLAVIIAVVWAALVPLFWRLSAQAGFPPTVRTQVEWAVFCALLLCLLTLANLVLPIELAGIAALGPVIVLRFLHFRGLSSLNLEIFRRLVPFLLLISALTVMQMWPIFYVRLSTPSFKPFFELPAFAPFLSPALPLILIALAVSLARHGPKSVVSLLVIVTHKGWRASLLTFLLVGMAYILVRGGIAHNLMQSASQSLEIWAAGLVPLAGAAGGYLTGSNTGAGAVSMPLANALSISMDARYVVVSAAIAAGSLMTAVSPIRIAMGLALSGAGPGQAQVALGLLTPFVLIVLFLTAIVAMAAVVAI
jgi:lactate permease